MLRKLIAETRTRAMAFDSNNTKWHRLSSLCCHFIVGYTSPYSRGNLLNCHPERARSDCDGQVEGPCLGLSLYLVARLSAVRSETHHPLVHQHPFHREEPIWEGYGFSHTVQAQRGIGFSR